MNFDLTPHKDLHAGLGLHKTITPMVGIYEAHLWNDRKNASKHKFEPIDTDADWLERIEDAEAVMLDIESLTNPKKPHTPELFDWFSDIVEEIRGFTSAPVYWYGTVYEPRSKFEWSTKKQFEWIDAWRACSLRHHIDGLLVPNYIRWNHREEDRMKLRAISCYMADLTAIGIYWTAYHNGNQDKTKQRAPIPHQTIKDHIELLKDTYDGVALWSPPTSYEPEKYRRQLHNSRLYALEVLN